MLEAADSRGETPLLTAADEGHVEVMSALIEAGANPNSRSWIRGTPLFVAAQEGHMDAVKMLLRAKADPLLNHDRFIGGDLQYVPLDIAAENGQFKVVRELLQQTGIEGCGGGSGGLNALRLSHTFPSNSMRIDSDAPKHRPCWSRHDRRRRLRR